jgi:hypothetical protein
MQIIITDNSFNQYTVNPFDNNKPYTHEWILLKLLEKADDFQQMTTGGDGQIFRFIITKELHDWKYRINDFIQYESTYDKNIILAMCQNDLDVAKAECVGHQYNDHYLRDYEQRVLVHSTTIDNYERIIRSGELKSWFVSKAEYNEWEDTPIGALLNDPVNYSNYVMFGTGGIYQELIPLSKQRGFIDMNLDGLYTAGARFYFNAEKIANDGLLIRDGVHLKVKDWLNIEKYLIWIATTNKLGIDNQTTPRIFAETADQLFIDRFGIPLDDTSY